MAASSPFLLHLLLMATIAIFGLMVAPPCAAIGSLNNPNSLLSGQALTTGSYRLTMQPDCNLVLHNAGRAIWASKTGGQGRGCRLTMENNGVLNLYNGRSQVIWSAGRAGLLRSYVLVLQQDGNVVIFGPGRWAARTTIVSQKTAATVDVAAVDEQVIINAAAMPSPNAAAVNSLTSPNSLRSGQALNTSRYSLVMQNDCNLVLYDGGRDIWATKTGGLGIGCFLTLHSNGNLIIFNGRSQRIWQTGTNATNGNYVLVLQLDRNLVTYGPSRWATNTGSVREVTVGPHYATAGVDAAAEKVITSAAAGVMVE